MNSQAQQQDTATPRLWIAIETFVITDRDDGDLWVEAGDIAEEGNHLLDAHRESFQLLNVRWRAPQTKRNRRRWVIRRNGSPDWWPGRQIGSKALPTARDNDRS